MVLSHDPVPDNVFVWLEGFDLSTFTDRDGDFNLLLPPPGSQGGGEGTSGEFNLFFFVANYELDSAQIVLVNGEVARQQGDLNEHRELRKDIVLTKILSVQTTVSPQTVPADRGDTLQVVTTLQAISNPVTVESLKKIVDHSVIRTGLILINDAGNFIKTIDLEGSVKTPQVIGKTPEIWTADLVLKAGGLPAGNYEVIPYLSIERDSVPPSLIEHLGQNVNRFGSDYLRLPFKRKNGRFQVVAGG